ncbi:MAG: RQC domain-containing protein, partial [Pirellulaceae bacterium]
IERMDTQQNLASVKITGDLPTLVDLLPRDARTRRHVLRGVESRVGPLRGERVYFPPRQLCDQLEMKWDALQRAMRELNKLDCFDYVPPFRGRAIHVLRREPFSKLDIDFGELERRKREEYRRLESVIGYCGSRICRQLEILEYFGDPERQPCGHCDNCQRSGPNAAGKTSLPIRENQGSAYAIQVTLSGVARTHGRFGKTLVAQMLCGSEARKLKQLGLDQLSTWGLLKALNQQQAISLLDALINGRLVEQSEHQKFRPVVSITANGSDVMRGQDLSLALGALPDDLRRMLNFQYNDRSPNSVEEEESSSSTEDSAAVDSTPTPSSHDDTAGTDAQVDLPPMAVQLRQDAPHDEDEIRPAWYWTWKLFEMGFEARQVAQIRQITQSELTTHLQIAENNSLEVSPHWQADLQPADPDNQ